VFRIISQSIERRLIDEPPSQAILEMILQFRERPECVLEEHHNSCRVESGESLWNVPADGGCGIPEALAESV